MDAVELKFLMTFLRPSESIEIVGVIDTKRVYIHSQILIQKLPVVLMSKTRNQESEMENSDYEKDMKLLLEISLIWYNIFIMTGKEK